NTQTHTHTHTHTILRLAASPKKNVPRVPRSDPPSPEEREGGSLRAHR
ncbi:hypothetical protein EGK_16124, partial [Macaca mulatta]